MATWLWVYAGSAHIYTPGIAPTLWHAHEMLYGYAFAVIAGFLLTAVKNWTGVQTPHRGSLAILFLFWVMARVSNHVAAVPLAVGGLADLAFNVFLVIAIAIPILKTRQWKQTAIVGKVLLLAVLNALFYLDVLGLFVNGAWWAVYGAFYTILALILMMARRLIPFFVERGVGYDVTLRNSKVLDIASLVLFVELMISELFGIWVTATLWVAAALFAIHLARLLLWYTPGIWRRPLLWSLYLAYAMLVLGFLLFALTGWLGIPKILALHAFAIGGIGVMTLSMMTRVSLGHSGRNIHAVPAPISIALVLLAGASITRVFAPMIDPAHYLLWVEVSGVLWIVAFAAFSAVFAPILLSPRTDGRYG